MFVGVILGIIIGVLPGLGGANGRRHPAAPHLLDGAAARRHHLRDHPAFVHLLGALFGGAITSILFNIPGEPGRLPPPSTATRSRSWGERERADRGV